MSSMKRSIFDMVPGILMFAMVLTAVASSEARPPERVADETAAEPGFRLQESAGQFALQVLAGAGVVLSGSADLNDQGDVCRSDDVTASRERQQRSF
jgi:hypothetical protein